MISEITKRAVQGVASLHLDRFIHRVTIVAYNVRDLTPYGFGILLVLRIEK